MNKYLYHTCALCLGAVLEYLRNWAPPALILMGVLAMIGPFDNIGDSILTAYLAMIGLSVVFGCAGGLIGLAFPVDPHAGATTGTRIGATAGLIGGILLMVL